MGGADELYLPIINHQEPNYKGCEEWIVLDSGVDDKIFNTLIASWLNYCYDGRPLDSQFLYAMQNNEIALNGGLRLMMNDRVINPSCCAEFGDLREWATIAKGQKPDIWLGHDPAPHIIYYQDYISVMSDNHDVSIHPSDDIFELKFSYQEFNDAFEKIMGDIIVIKQFSEKWALNNLPINLQKPFVQTFCQFMELDG